MLKLIERNITERHWGTVINITISFLLTTWFFVANRFEINLFLTFFVLFFLIAIQIRVAILQRRYAKNYSKLEEKYKHFIKCYEFLNDECLLYSRWVQSINKIRTTNLGNINKYIKYVNIHGIQYEQSPIITDPQEQLIKIRDEFEISVLDLFGRRGTADVETTLAYKIHFLDGSSSDWKSIDDTSHSTAKTFNDLANDPRSTFYSVLVKEDPFAFHPRKKDVLRTDRDAAKKLGKEEGRYYRSEYDKAGYPGSIICKHFAIVNSDNVKTKYIEAVVSLATFKNPLISKEDGEEFTRKYDLLKHEIIRNLERKMANELALFYIDKIHPYPAQRPHLSIQ
ncbi:MAG: hypothetical protein FWE06_06630 [Oscillospiraceae bacterium]|nr:hypothetical protein [Oscillospiraceae bacterium]